MKRRLVDVGTVGAWVGALVVPPWLYSELYSRSFVYREVISEPKRKLPAVLTQRRPTPKELEFSKRAEDQRIQRLTKTFWLPEYLTGSDTETWPESLQLFEYYLTGKSTWSAPKPAEIVLNLRKYYPGDKTLMEFADFIQAAEADDPQVTFRSSYKHVVTPRSTDGSFKVFE